MQRLFLQQVAALSGFQNQARFIETVDKIAMIDALSQCGFAKIEVTSLTSPKAITALRDAEAVMQGIRRYPAVEYSVLHNTRGTALANALANIEAGVDRFDSSLGGMGGCPNAPGASGNVCTEDLLHMLQLMGFSTGVDLDRMLAVAAQLPGLIGHHIPSQILKAGERLDLHPIPAHVASLEKQVPSARTQELHP